MKRTVEAEQLARRVRTMRNERGWYARELAERCRQAGSATLNRSALSKIESMNRAVRDDELALLARVFEVPVAVLRGVEHDQRTRYPEPGPAQAERAPRAHRPPFPVAAGAGLVDGPPEHPRPSREPGTRTAVTVLHLAAPRFGGPSAVPPGALCSALADRVERLVADGAPRPDLILVTGDLTEHGTRREFEDARELLVELPTRLGLGPGRLMIVPGRRDITMAACRAYFDECEADEIAPRAPYWPKWRHYSRLFNDLYRGLDPTFDQAEPWTLYVVPELRVVVAGLNSTVAVSHRPGDDRPMLDMSQGEWFIGELRRFEEGGWLRLGIVADDPLLLADCPVLDQPIAARRLNLLVHGSPGRDIGATEAGLTLMPAAPDPPAPDPPAPDAAALDAAALDRAALGPGRIQLLRIGPDTLSRRPVSPAGAGVGEQVVLRRQWGRATATFGPPTGPAIAVGANSGEGPRLATPGTPLQNLVERITEVCLTRAPAANIRAGRGGFPYLLISVGMDDTAGTEKLVVQRRVGVHLGEVTQGVLDHFVASVHAGDPGTVSELVYDGTPATAKIRESAARVGVRLRSFLEFQGLLDLRDQVRRQTERLASDQAYPLERYVPQRFRELRGPDRSEQSDLCGTLVRLLTGDAGRFILLLGDFGTGKTFALRQVAHQLAGYPHLTPIYIELRELDKVHSVDGLVAAHLANHGHQVIDLKAFRYLLREGRIVLLFDGFDELVTRVTYDRAAEHLTRLIQATEGNAKIVVASRTQHFRTDQQVLTALGEEVGVLPNRSLLSIEPFTEKQILSYLVGRYGDQHLAESRFDSLRKIRDLVGLAANPRMLGFIADLGDDQLRAAMSTPSGHPITAALLYRSILQAWLSFEERRTQGVAGAPPGLTTDDLWRAITTLAVRLWETGETHLGEDELGEVTQTLTGLASGRLTTSQTVHAIGAGSVLTRTEGGSFGFIHGSVVEWLVANHIAGLWSDRPGAPELLRRRRLTGLVEEFLCSLADPEPILAWAQEALDDPGAGDVVRANASALRHRLKAPPAANLKGVSLRGEDLSNRTLAGVDLSGSDLTNAQLVATDLRGAVLAGSTLSGARLERAVLTGADLTGANLRRTRVIGTDMCDLTVTGSDWTRAAVVASPGAELLGALPELRGAAIVPGRPVEFGLSPAVVGPSYGFERGRIPHPMAYSPDGDLVAVGADDGTVLICDGWKGYPIRVLDGHRGRVYAVAFTPDGQRLITGGSDRVIGVWDANTGERLSTLDGQQGWVWPVITAPDSRLLAVGDDSGTVRLWDTVTGRVRHRLTGHTERVWTAGFSPDSRVVATGDSGAVRLWDTGDGRLLHRLEQSDPVYRLDFSADGRLLATVGAAGVVRLWDPDRRVLLHELTGHAADVYTVDFSPDGRSLATGDASGAVWLWNLTGSPTGRLLATNTGAVYRVCFSPGGALLATGDSDGVIQLWDTATGTRQLEINGHKSSTWPMVFRHDGTQLGTSSIDGSMVLWDTGSGDRRAVRQGHGRRLTTVRFSPDGRLLAATGNDSLVRFWDPATGEQVRTLDRTSRGLAFAEFNPQEPIVATATPDGGVVLRGTDDVSYERTLNIGTEAVWAAAFSADGDMLATANDDDSVRLWFWKTNRLVRTLLEHRSRVRAIAFSRDGRWLATGCDDRQVRLWRVADGVLAETLPGHTGRVYDVRFSPDSRWLVSASTDGTAALWDLADPADLTTRHVLAGHEGQLWAAAFSPDSSLLATSGDDHVIRLWDVAGRTPRDTLAGHTSRVWTLDFSPDGAMLASGGDDGTVRLWSMDGARGTLAATLLGLPAGWASFSPAGHYKTSGDVRGDLWHVIGMCRFELGVLDEYLPDVRQIGLGVPL